MHVLSTGLTSFERFSAKCPVPYATWIVKRPALFQINNYLTCLITNERRQARLVIRIMKLIDKLDHDIPL